MYMYINISFVFIDYDGAINASFAGVLLGYDVMYKILAVLGGLYAIQKFLFSNVLFPIYDYY